MHGSNRLSVLAAVAALALGCGPGCSRKFFRECADKDVAGIITQKNKFPDWMVRNWHVYPDPRARFADPFNPDRPPYPPDDYAARSLSPNPQHPTKKTGTGRIDGDGYLRLLEQWDAENRGSEPVPARGAPPDRLFLPGPAAYAQAAASSGAKPAGYLTAREPESEPWMPAGSAGKPRGPRVVEVRDSVVPAGGAKTAPGTLPDKLAIPVAPDAGQSTEPKAEPVAPPKADAGPGGIPGIQMLLDSNGSNDSYLRALASNQQGFRLKVDQAVQLGLINSREFQDRREDLYLAALPVTLERYNFAAQAFFTEQVIRRSVGSALADAGQQWEMNTTTGIGKLFPTGAQLLVQLANQVVIDLGSDQPHIAISNLTLSLFQPFLRGGGFAVNLEGLTQAERTMVYAIRSYARFRKLFYIATVAGQAGGLGLTNNPYGLQGLSVNLGRGIGGNLTSPVVGFYPLLQQAAAISNQMKNVAALEQLYRQYVAFRESGQIAPLQVDQVEVDLLNSRGQLLGQGGGGGGGSGIRGYLDSLDSFKLQLGLPMTVALDLDNTPLKPIREQLARFEDVYADLRQLEEEARRYDPAAPADQLRVRWRRLLTESELLKDTPLAQGIGPRWEVWAKRTDEQLAAALTTLRNERTELLNRKADRQRIGQNDPPEEVQRLTAVEREIELGLFERSVRAYEARPWLKEKGPAAASIQASTFLDSVNAFYQLALDGRNQRLEAVRRQWPVLPGLLVNGTDILTASLDDSYTSGIQTALSLRLDLMNARGQVVDAYRQIAVQANSLQGVFDVRYDLNANTPPGERLPFGFAPDRTRHQLILRGELPLVRRAERNNYRAALIAYQRQRRTLMAFEDNIANDVRNDIRELRTIAELYKIQQRVVELGYSQVDNARQTFFAPLAANQGVDPGASAALTQQLLTAQRNLVNAQNTLYSLWVSYLTARMNLYSDLELMQIDERGVWIDEQATGLDDPARSGPERGPAERLPAPQPLGPADRK